MAARTGNEPPETRTMDLLTFGWAAAALLVFVCELTLGTVYLLAWAAGLVVGALLQWLTGSWSIAAGAATLVTFGGSLVAQRVRHTRYAQKMDDVDIGGEARLLRPLGADRWRVAFRGTEWDARISGEAERTTVGAIAKVCGREANLLLLIIH